jgi:hypothetical protein
MHAFVAHGPGGGLGLLAFLPVGFLLLVGLVLMISPVVSEIGRPAPKEDEDDLANQVLGEDEARELRRRARRKRAVRRRSRRSGSSGQSPGGGHGWH